LGVELLNDVRQILPLPTPVAIATNLRQNGYNSACVRDISEMFSSNRGFSGSSYRTTSEKFLQRQTLVATATKFETKWVIT